jgi:hypothetical protein
MYASLSKRACRNSRRRASSRPSLGSAGQGAARLWLPTCRCPGAEPGWQAFWATLALPLGLAPQPVLAVLLLLLLPSPPPPLPPSPLHAGVLAGS